MKYAVIKLAGKQFKVSEGDIFEIERQKGLDLEVLSFTDGDTLKVGNPVLKDVTVKAVLVEEKMGDKINVSRFRSKSRYRRNKGHRQPVSVIKIEKINKKAEKKAKVEEKKEE